MRDEKVNRVGVIVQAVRNGHDTSKKVARATGISRDTARDYLRRLTSAGKLQRRLASGRNPEFLYQALDTEAVYY